MLACLQKAIKEGGKIYWLELHMTPSVATPLPRFGWKTSLDHWNDDAVWFDDQAAYQELYGPLAQPLESSDMVFVIVAYYTGARRGDLLRLEWDRDIDLDGSKMAPEGRTGPHIYIRGSKADTPHWMPLHPVAVDALRALRAEPVISPEVFPVPGSMDPASRVSRLFAELCVKAGLTEEVERHGETFTKNRWSLHDLRRKANTDLRNRGASAKERAALLGHRTTAVNEAHYEALTPGRERELIDGLPVFGKTA